MKLIYRVFLLITVFFISSQLEAKVKKTAEPRTAKNYYLPIRRAYRKHQTEECKRSQYRGVYGCRTHPRAV